MNIGLDTNLLVRYLTDDDPDQADKVEALFNSLSSDTTLLINEVVLAELDWVLTSVYKYSRQKFLKIANQLFETEKLAFSKPILVKKACKIYSESKADFSDCYLGVINDNAGCKTTYTFDVKAAELSGFTLLE